MNTPKLLFRFAVLVVIVYIVAFALFGTQDDLIDKPLGEDAYYMFSIARNIARGEGIVYNYQIPTNGVQPLIMLPYTAIYVLTETMNLGAWTPLRIILLLNLSFLIVTALLANSLVKKYATRLRYNESDVILAGNLTLLLFVVNINMVRQYLYGLETGLYLLLIVLLTRLLVPYDRLRDIPMGRVLLVGIVCGLTILARIDFIIILGALLVFTLVPEKLNKSSLLKASVVGLCAILVSSPWFIYNLTKFGSFMPSSGTSQSVRHISLQTIGSNTQAALWAIVDHLLVFFWLPRGQFGQFEIIVGIFKLMALAVVIWVTWRHIAPSLRWPLNGFIFGLMVLVGSYIFLINAQHFYPRYFSPLLVFWLLLIVVAVPLLLQTMRQKFAVLSVRAGIVCTLIVYMIFAGYTLHRGAISNNHVYSARWIDINQKNNARIGAFQSGVIGYFHENVFNLDGKVNPDALAHLLDGTMECYVLTQKMEYLIDWPSSFDILPDDFRTTHMTQISEINGGSSIVLQVDLDKPYKGCESSQVGQYR